MTGCNVHGNSAHGEYPTSGSGGAIYAGDGSRLLVVDSKLLDNDPTSAAAQSRPARMSLSSSATACYRSTHATAFLAGL